MVPPPMTDVVNRQVELARASGARDRTAIFLHIGKTAGTTLNSVLDRGFEPEAIFTVDTYDPATAEAQLARLPADGLERLRLIRGHFIYGVHRVLPQPALYFSLLRHPYERLMSAYLHIRSVPRHRLHRQVVDEGLSFEEFVTSGITLETDNWQLRCLAGDVDTPFGACGEAMVQRAIENIGRDFALVGVAERFDDSLLVLSRMYGWRSTGYVRLNEGTSERPDVAPSVLDAIEAQIALERELYAQASEILTSISAMLPGLGAARQMLRWRNAGQRGIRRAKRVLRRSKRQPGAIES